jgi:hypothetical protein
MTLFVELKKNRTNMRRGWWMVDAANYPPDAMSSGQANAVTAYPYRQQSECGDRNLDVVFVDQINHPALSGPLSVIRYRGIAMVPAKMQYDCRLHQESGLGKDLPIRTCQFGEPDRLSCLRSTGEYSGSP